eukprot:scaffold150342_cov32-Tisochrysis_lutea.AAC.2
MLSRCSNLLSPARALVSRGLSSRVPRRREGPPAEGEKLHILFPRKGAYQASMEVKKRILAATPHMGGQRLKQLARLHARKGTMDSFVADLESRLDRFLVRCNLVRRATARGATAEARLRLPSSLRMHVERIPAPLTVSQVPSIFAARHLIGHKHILVNGRPANRSGMILEPMAIVEPRPQSKALFRKLIQLRLANNTFVFANRDKSGTSSQRSSADPDADGSPKQTSAPENHGVDLARLRKVRP